MKLYHVSSSVTVSNGKFVRERHKFLLILKLFVSKYILPILQYRYSIYMRGFTFRGLNYLLRAAENDAIDDYFDIVKFGANEELRHAVVRLLSFFFFFFIVYRHRLVINTE